MNNTSGFKDMRSSILRSSAYRFMHELRQQFLAGPRLLLHAHDLNALSTGISTKRETFTDTVSALEIEGQRKS
jgi:hypothetical protein